jgi:hypothetical protein
MVGSGLEITRVVFTVTRPPSTTSILADTVPFSLDSTQLRADLQVVLNSSQEQLTVRVDYQNSAGRTLFSGSVDVTVSPGGSQSPPPIQTVYQGPGGNVDTIALAPRNPQVAAGGAVTFTLSAFDGQRAPIPPESVYVSWRASTAAAQMNATGVLTAPAAPGSFWVYARTPVTTGHPNGLADSTQVSVVSGGIVIQPDSVEKLPGGTQQFTVVQGPGGPYIWSVNGQDGGGRTYGTIDASGFYSAPVSTPQPPKFPVCARSQATPTIQGCAVVVINPVPTAGADMIVINDMNVFDGTAMTDPNNQLFVHNLVTFTSSGSRNAGTRVVYDRGRNSPCFGDGECGDQQQVIIDSVITAAGFTIEKIDTVGDFSSIAPDVKVIFLWNPLVAYTTAEVNSFKQFAGQGGRIIFVGEYLGFYGQPGIDLENGLLGQLGAQLTNTGASIDCGYVVLPQASLRPHQITTGMTDLTIACASYMNPGPNDFALFYDTGDTLVLGGAAKIDLTPLPAPPAPIRLNATSRTSHGLAPRKPSPRALGPRGDGAHR